MDFTNAVTSRGKHYNKKVVPVFSSGTTLNVVGIEDDCRNIRLLSDTSERKACIDDLLHFVGEISLAEQGALLLTSKERDQVLGSVEPYLSPWLFIWLIQYLACFAIQASIFW